jgi:hypothetical protein
MSYNSEDDAFKVATCRGRAEMVLDEKGGWTENHLSSGSSAEDRRQSLGR